MWRNTGVLILALGLAAPAAPARAQALADKAPAAPPAAEEKQPAATPVAGTPRTENADREGRIQVLKTRQVALQSLLVEREHAYQKLRQTFSEKPRSVQEALKELDDLKKELATVSQELASLTGERERRLRPLRRPVDLQLRDATIRQAAEALSKASGTPIRVEAGVPEDARLTLDASAMPLAVVLEAIAGKTVLMIAPGAEGVVLRRWPTLTVDGATHVVTGPLAPWSDDWELSPTRTQDAPQEPAVAPGDVTQALPPAPGGPALAPVPAGPISAGRPGFFYRPGGMGPGGFSVASLGDHAVVVAEPGPGPQGEPGLWLTVYRLDGGQLKKAGAVFHPSSFGGSARVGIMAPGLPDLPRAPIAVPAPRRPVPTTPAVPPPAAK